MAEPFEIVGPSPAYPGDRIQLRSALADAEAGKTGEVVEAKRRKKDRAVEWHLVVHWDGGGVGRLVWPHATILRLPG